MRSRRLRRRLLFLLLLLLLIIAFLSTRDLRRADLSALRPAARQEDEDPFPFAMDVAPLFDANYLPVLLHEMETARSSIEVSMYLAQTPRGASRAIIDALAAAARRGVKVRVLFEDKIESNRDWAVRLAAMGVEARLDDPEVKLHDKAVLIDGRTFIAGSHNWSNAALRFNREASLLIRAEPAAFQEWRARFEKAYAAGEEMSGEDAFGAATLAGPPLSRFPSRPPPPLERGRGRIAADADYVKAAEQIVGLMERSFTAAIYYVSIESLTQRRPLSRFFERLVAKAESHPCEVLLDQMEISEEPVGRRDNDNTIPYLRERGIRAGFDSEETTHHVKAIAVDGRYLLLGSHNWTISSTSWNMETSILVDAPRATAALERHLGSIERQDGTRSVRAGSPVSPGARADTAPGRLPLERLIRVH